VRLDLVFFSVCRTVSCESESVISNATASSASSRSAQRALPAGGFEHASAISCASCLPSSLR
jgi:hypothetical protein